MARSFVDIWAAFEVLHRRILRVLIHVFSNDSHRYAVRIPGRWDLIRIVKIVPSFKFGYATRHNPYAAEQLLFEDRNTIVTLREVCSKRDRTF